MLKIYNVLKIFFPVLLMSVNISASPQDYNTERTALTNFLVRMYNSAPFAGVRVVEDYENAYLLSVLILEKSRYPSESMMTRVASIKAMSQASRFFNGSNITSDLVIRISEKSDGAGDTEIIENIKENSIGYVKQLEMLSNFPAKDDGWQVFMYFKKLDLNKEKTECH